MPTYESREIRIELHPELLADAVAEFLETRGFDVRTWARAGNTVGGARRDGMELELVLASLAPYEPNACTVEIKCGWPGTRLNVGHTIKDTLDAFEEALVYTALDARETGLSMAVQWRPPV